MKKQYAPAFKHEPIEPLLDNIYWVHGSVKMAPAMHMNRNMIIIKEGEELVLINPVRLNSAEEKRLKAMGKVKAIIRLGDFHGLDDQYYVNTFGGAFWCQPKQTTYPFPKADHEISPQAEPPIAGAEFFIFSTARYPESALLLRDKKLLITCDSIQYWTDWQHMTRAGKALLWMMGFRTGLFIGKPWLKRVSPKEKSLQSDFNKLLELDFEHLIAAHGKPLLNTAKEKVRQVVSSEFTSLK